MDRDQPVLGVILLVAFVALIFLGSRNSAPGRDEVAALADKAIGGDEKAFGQLFEMAPNADGGTGMQLGIELVNLQEKRPQAFWQRLLSLTPELRRDVLRVLWGGSMETNHQLNTILPLKYAPTDRIATARKVRWELLAVEAEYQNLVKRNLNATQAKGRKKPSN